MTEELQEQIETYLTDEYEDYSPIISINLEDFAYVVPVPLEVFFGDNETSNATLVYLRNEDTNHRVVLWLPNDPDTAAYDATIVDDPPSIKRVEIIIVSTLLFEDYPLTDDQIASIHKNIDVEKLSAEFGEDAHIL